MPLSVDGVLFDVLASDPSSPSEGQMWFNTTTHVFGIYRNGAATYFTDYVQFNAHAGSTSNPHATTLEQARTAGATLSGAIAMGGNAITGLAAGSNATDAAQRQWVTDQINSKVKGLDWQDPVINSQTTPPVPTPSEGDRYRITATATGVWAGKENQIATWTSGAWVYTVPVEGFILRDMTANTYIVYDGSAWANLGNAVDHNALLNLTSGDVHTQYPNVNGTRFSDTTHGSRGGGSLHPVCSASGAGFMAQSNMAATTNPGVNNDNTQGYAIGSQWVNTTAGTIWEAVNVATGAAIWKELTNIAGVLATKSGKVLAASFGSNPKKATITFATAFADANYSVTLTPVISVNGTTYAPNIESQTAAGFVINMGANNIGSLIQVNWTAVKNGESA
jgi:hypothetical protein